MNCRPGPACRSGRSSTTRTPGCHRAATGLLRPTHRTPAGHRRYSDAGHDTLVERYRRLVRTVNDRQVVPGHLPFQPWLVEALRRSRPEDRHSAS
ncbi:hypothetical protein [Streptomyces sp. AC627_RSS907]|uniref:hypothetical protein n=1 Tax=Streptomyces sp. AC627_RSS907 TaxID=2823684 RepID=UPI0020B8D804|nr:hypothetical protein [Streptomyces sp. AC627_RSS907]